MKKWLPTISYVILLILFCHKNSNAQLVIEKLYPQFNVQEAILGNGVLINTIYVSSDSTNIGYFRASKNTNLGLDSGILISTGRALDAVGPNNLPNAGVSLNLPGHYVPLKLLSTENLYDEVLISIQFIPLSTHTSFRFVFASEEYPESVSKNYNDVFGIFINGAGYTGTQNVALIPGTNNPISVATINANTNPSLYIDNTNGQHIQYDAYTKVMTANIETVPCSTYTLVIAIADAKDPLYDSGVFIEANSLSSDTKEDLVTLKILHNERAQHDELNEGCDYFHVAVVRTGDISDSLVVKLAYTGSATNHLDYIGPEQVTIPAHKYDYRFKIPILEDTLKEGTETMIIELEEFKFCGISQKRSARIYDLDILKINGYSLKECKGDTLRKRVDVEGGSGRYSILWITSTNEIIGDTTFTDSISPQSPLTVYVHVTDLCTGEVLIDTIVINPIVPVSLSINKADTILCLGDTLQLFSYTNLPDAKFQWHPNFPGYFDNSKAPNPVFTMRSEAPLRIICMITNEDICYTYKSFEVKTYQKAMVSYPKHICIGDTIIAKAKGGVSYDWQPASDIAYQTDSTVYLIPSEVTEIQYSVNITDAIGCTQEHKFKVEVHAIPIVDAGEDKMVCADERTPVSLDGNVLYAPEVEWSPKELVVNYKSMITEAIIDKNTTFYLKAISQGGCFVYDSVFVRAYTRASVDYTIDVDSCERVIHINNYSRGAEFQKWDFGDGNFSEEFSPTHKYDSSGNYTVSMVANDRTPCSDARQMQIHLEEISTLEKSIPNVFTPNGDGVNDVFRIVGGNSFCLIRSITIFNRWGEILFESNDPYHYEWDGTVNGRMVSPGTYFYRIKLEDSDQTGNITVLY